MKSDLPSLCSAAGVTAAPGMLPASLHHPLTDEETKVQKSQMSCHAGDTGGSVHLCQNPALTL